MNATPLHFACQSGSLGIIKLLIERGVNVNARADSFQAYSYYIPNVIILNFKHDKVTF